MEPSKKDSNRESSQMTRRDFLRLVAITSAGIGIASCAPAALITPIPPRGLNVPPWTPVPPSTPIVRGEQISKEEFEIFGPTLHTIFEKAYNTNPSIVAHNKDTSIPISWDDETMVTTMQQSFNDQFQRVLNNNANPLIRAIKTRADQSRADSKKGIPLFSNWGSPEAKADYIYTLKAIRDLYNEQGYAVEYKPTIIPPLMTIYKPQFVDRKRGRMSALEVPIIGTATRYEINNNAVLFDSFPLLGLDSHPADEAYGLDGPEYFLHMKEVDELGLKLFDMDHLTDPEDNPPPQDTDAIAVRNAAKRIIGKINQEEGKVIDINRQVIDLHSRMHLVAPHMLMVPNEMRSYIAQLGAGSEIKGGARLSLATLLYSVSQSRYLNVLRGTIGFAIYPGVGETLDLLIQTITNDFKQDQAMRDKLSLSNAPQAEYVPNNGQSGNFILPSRHYSPEYVTHILSRLDTLDDSDIRRIAKKMFDSQKNQHWFGPGLEPVVGWSQKQSDRRAMITNPIQSFSDYMTSG